MSEPTHFSRWGHLRSLVTPGIAFAFLLAAPRSLDVVLAFLALPFALDLAASGAEEEPRSPPVGGPRWPFDLLLLTLGLLHTANLILGARYVSAVGWATPQAAVGMFLLILSCSLCAGAVGHELIHRRSRLSQTLGRLLLATFFYEHLYTEHLRGHHARAGTPEDPTTARLGESLLAYYARAIPGQYASAWRLERQRLADRSWPVRLLGNRVLQGIAVEVALAAAFWLGWGAVGLAVFVVQGVFVNLIFQVINYFEHWGAVRGDGGPAAVSWDTTNKSSLFSMIGLARHADHHAHPRRAFHELELAPASLRLPRGYGGMVWLAVADNRKFQRLMREQLEAHAQASSGAGASPTRSTTDAAVVGAP